MKDLKKILATVLMSALFCLSVFAGQDRQRNDPKPPPQKEPKVVEKPPKNDPPPPRNDGGQKNRDDNQNGRKGKP